MLKTQKIGIVENSWGEIGTDEMMLYMYLSRLCLEMLNVLVYYDLF